MRGIYVDFKRHRTRFRLDETAELRDPGIGILAPGIAKEEHGPREPV